MQDTNIDDPMGDILLAFTALKFSAGISERKNLSTSVKFLSSVYKPFSGSRTPMCEGSEEYIKVSSLQKYETPLMNDSVIFLQQPFSSTNIGASDVGQSHSFIVREMESPFSGFSVVLGSDWACLERFLSPLRRGGE